jgi:hypothetical protein
MSREIHYKRTHCRACGSDRLRCFLELGPQPLANAFLHTEDEFSGELYFPLDVYFCEDCALVQLLNVIDPEVLFRDYIYVTGTSDTIAAHNLQYARTVVDFLHLTPDDLVVEVASNDGSLLKCFQNHHVRILGVEPATNIAAMANQRGVDTINEFFDAGVGEKLATSYGPAKAVIGNNVFAHVDDSQNFLRGFKNLLDEDGLAIIEVPYLSELVDRLEYDTIYHEHLCYFSVSTLMRLCDAVGLSVVRMDRVPVHGGSLRMYAGLPAHYGGHAEAVVAMARQEDQLGLNSYERYNRLARDVAHTREALLELLHSLKSQGKSLAAYGAPAKGNTLLNYCHIDNSMLAFTVDKNPMKVGTYTPGMHLPVLPVSGLLEHQPDYVLILAWNFASEIMRQQQAYAERGGHFILPIPEPKVI